MLETLPWFFHSIAAVLTLGVAMALYKLPAFKSQNRYAVTFWANAVALVFALIFFGSALGQTTFATVGFASLWGLLFATTSLLQMKALKTIETNVLFPITSTASAFLAALAGVLVFADVISPLQALGGLVMIGVVLLFKLATKKDYSVSNWNSFLLLGAAIVTSSTLGKIIQKTAAISVNPDTFIIYQNLFAALFALLAGLVFSRGMSLKTLRSKGEAISGLKIGVFMFTGGVFIVYALTTGPLSLVYTIHPAYTLITALTAVVLFKEKLTWKKTLLIFVAIAAVLLIRLG